MSHAAPLSRLVNKDRSHCRNRARPGARANGLLMLLVGSGGLVHPRSRRAEDGLLTYFLAGGFEEIP
jgi:hypothetical protein